MSLLSLVEASMYSGYSIELLQYFSKKCPKYKDNKKLKIQNKSKIKYIDEIELKEYIEYLKQPWPVRKGSTRADIPDAIKEDVKRESHYGCAICGHMDNGEVAHIEAYSKYFNNSPDNLIYLCPNHHTKYDYGYIPVSNLTMDVIRSAKQIKRESRRRMLRFEDNTVKEFTSLIKYIKKLQKDIDDAPKEEIASIKINELKNIMNFAPEITQKAIETAKKDKESEISKIILKNAPRVSKFAVGILEKSEKQILNDSQRMVEASADIIIDLDEVECPHCNGRGQTGLVGDICSYCGGSCFISQEKADAYDPDDLDEVECPHCNGRGQTGLVGDICSYCGGSCFISQEKADAYDPDDLDEVECPHCNGRGQTGLVGDICSYCGGSCFISKEEANKYDPDKLDEVECPHCHGSGQTGLVGDICKLCEGSQFVSKSIRTAYYEKYGK
ncbi:MAG: HNH endonuclease [Spirochaetes bacterium]|nr:HNH endonuclease [Spirochaetota bacterium]